MRHAATTVLLAASLALAGCSAPPTPDGASDSVGTHTSTPTPGPAQKLADLDEGDRPASQYQKALNTWASRCNETKSTLAGYVYATVEDLRKNGINDETEYSALTHLRDSTPAGVKTKCEDVAAGYLTLRESRK
jgi:hypothetical protein